ncbi:hypothetical protein [Streptomyces sp. NPDC088246]|uniref:hypothetical protein n=1 Tax=Streptomyces sp. NPDC088246 TaxID=3365842 RepID=UPI003819DFF5
MAFNSEQFQAIIDKLNSGLTTLSTDLNSIGPRVEKAVNHWWVPDAVARALIWIVNKIIEGVNYIIGKVLEFLKGVAAPFILFADAITWQGEEIRGKASGVASATQKFNLKAPRQWEGHGANAYTNAVFPQSAAGAQVASSSSTVSTCLTACGTAGVAFYVTLGIFIAQLIPVLAASTVAAASVVGLPAAGGAAVAETALGAATIVTAVGGLLTALGAQLPVMAALTGESVDKMGFPEGHWPVGTA